MKMDGKVYYLYMYFIISFIYIFHFIDPVVPILL
jgi:hypothetical protein